MYIYKYKLKNQHNTLLTKGGKVRYMLLDYNNEPVQPVLQYLKFKDNSGASCNVYDKF